MTTKTSQLKDRLSKATGGTPRNGRQPPKDEKNPFRVRPAGEWLADAATRPIPKKLFGELWVEGELSVLFAPTNVGKSILAVQIADCITKGLSWGPLRVQAPAQKVIFFDFELSDRQFCRRYSEDKDGRYTNLYKFSDRFLRAEPATVEEVPNGISFTDYYLNWMEHEILRHDAKTIIIDNITWINSKLEKSADAGPFMMRLSKMKRQYDLSILLIAHTPKRDTSREITVYDLQGSAMLGNFLDSCFAVNKSRKDPQLRYIKQVKVRDAEELYHEESVISCTLDKAGNWLSYQFLEFSREKDHLHIQSDDDKDKRDAQIIELYKEHQSFRVVGDLLGISHMTVKRVWEKQDNEEDPF